MDLVEVIRIEMVFNFSNVVAGDAQDAVKVLLSTLKNWESSTTVSNRGGSVGEAHVEDISIEIPITNTNEVKRVKDKICQSIDDEDFLGYVLGSLRIVYTGDPVPVVEEEPV